MLTIQETGCAARQGLAGRDPDLLRQGLHPGPEHPDQHRGSQVEYQSMFKPQTGTAGAVGGVGGVRDRFADNYRASGDLRHKATARVRRVESSTD